MRDGQRNIIQKSTRPGLISLLVFLAQLFFPAKLPAYSLLSHETLVDAVWETGILPLLRERFPATTPHDFLIAHGSAYGARSFRILAIIHAEAMNTATWLQIVSECK
jgi:hypothetical protein